MAGLIASALAGGLTGAAEAGGKALFEQMKSDLEEQKALRIAEATEARKNAPMERFSGLVNAKMGEQVPVEAAPAAQYSPGQGLDPSRTPDLIARINALPDSNPDKAPMLAQLKSQLEANQQAEQEKVAGQTRPRTLQEATKAAKEESLRTDPGAYLAGETLTAADKRDIEELKIASREKISKDELAQRERADARKFDAMMARFESMTGGSAEKKTELRRNVELLQELKFSPEKVEDYITQRKSIPLEDTAVKFLATDITGQMTPEEAAKRAVALRNALAKSSAPGASAAPAEGTRLRKNGQNYIVKGGIPVLESEANRTGGGKIQ